MVDQDKLIAAIASAAKLLSRKDWTNLRAKLRDLAGLPDDMGRFCFCGKRVVSKRMCAKHYNEERDRHAPPCACGNPVRTKGMCKACYQRTTYRTAKRPPCTQPRHSWTNQGICKICRASYNQSKVRIDADK